jgi:hypothetical protein
MQRLPGLALHSVGITRRVPSEVAQLVATDYLPRALDHIVD